MVTSDLYQRPQENEEEAEGQTSIGIGIDVDIGVGLEGSVVVVIVVVTNCVVCVRRMDSVHRERARGRGGVAQTGDVLLVPFWVEDDGFVVVGGGLGP